MNHVLSIIGCLDLYSFVKKILVHLLAWIVGTNLTRLATVLDAETFYTKVSVISQICLIER